MVVFNNKMDWEQIREIKFSETTACDIDHAMQWVLHFESGSYVWCYEVYLKRKQSMAVARSWSICGRQGEKRLWLVREAV